MEPSGLGAGFGMVSALASALGWTLVTLVARDLAAQFPSLSLNIIRSAGASVLLVPVALTLGNVWSLGQVSVWAWTCLTVSVLAAIGIGDTAFFESTKSLGLGRAMTIATAGHPILASLFALWWFGEEITATVAVGSLVTLGGLALILSERRVETDVSREARRRGLGLALLAALAWAVSAALMKPPVQEIDPLTIQAVRMPGSALILWATPWARGTVRTLWTQRRTVGRRVVLLSVLTAMSAVAYLSGLRYAGVTLGTVLSSVSPLFALPIGLLAFGERLTWRATMGAVLAVAGIAILSR
ncbi:MAG: DMT family transporter [Candidatus Rokuibacteriota bacterium]